MCISCDYIDDEFPELITVEVMNAFKLLPERQ